MMYQLIGLRLVEAQKLKIKPVKIPLALLVKSTIIPLIRVAEG